MFEKRTIILIAVFIGLPYLAVNMLEEVWTPENLISQSSAAPPSSDLTPEQLAILNGADPTALFPPAAAGGQPESILSTRIQCAIGRVRANDSQLKHCDNYASAIWDDETHIHLFCAGEMLHAHIDASNSLTMTATDHDETAIDLALANISQCQNQLIDIGVLNR